MLTGKPKRFAVLALAALVGLLPDAQAGVATPQPYQLQVPRNEARDSLNGILDDWNARGSRPDAASLRFAERLMRTYRPVADAAQDASRMSIADGPYLTAVLLQREKDIYEGLYADTYREQLQKFLGDIPVELLFDAFLQQILDGTVSPAQRRQAGEIGRCMARKALAASGAACALDPDPEEKNPATLQLLLARVSCRHTHRSACEYRRLLFAAAKPSLYKARRSPDVQKQARDGFIRAFPAEYQKGFLPGLADIKKGLPELLSAKFKGEVDDFWKANVPLIDTERPETGQVSMREFVAGMRADLRLAALYAESDDRRERGLAAALFYAAANRLLVLTGQDEATWDGGKFVALPPAIPPAPTSLGAASPTGVVLPAMLPMPRLASNRFGGFGVERGTLGAIAFTPWDWAGYDPTAFRLFPVRFVMGPRAVARSMPGEDPVETLSDLADLMTGLGEFLAATAPQSALFKYFGDASDAKALIDPKNPMIFPREGRVLAVGVLAGVLKNLVAPGNGHLEIVTPGTPGGELGLLFHDLVAFGVRDTGNASIRGVSKILTAAAELRPVIQGDADVPAELKVLLPQLDQAVQIGVFSLVARGQHPDGGFDEHLGQTLSDGRNLLTTVAGLRAITYAYDASKIPAQRLSIRLGWEFLDRFWTPASPYPRPIEGSGAESLLPADGWRILRLWDETQRTARPDLAAEVDWAKWETRMATLRQRLNEQLGTDQGPLPLN